LATVDTAKNLELARTRAGYTQENLASRLGVSPRSIRGWESKGVPDKYKVVLRETLGADIFDPHFGEVDEPRSDKPDETLGDYLERRFTEEGLRTTRARGERIGLSPQTVLHLIAGTRTPSDDTVRKIAAGLGGDLTRLRTLAGLPPGEFGPYIPPPRASQMSAKERRVVDGVIHAILDAHNHTD
jgi:transcriptional regulator with XRE-family HTH domain